MDVFHSTSWQCVVTHFCLGKACLDCSLCAVLHHWDSGIKGPSKSKSIVYPVFVCCDVFFWLCVYRMILKNVRAFSFAVRSKAQDCPPAALPRPAQAESRSRETIKARYQEWQCLSWAAGLVTAHSSHPCLWPPTPLVSPKPLTLSHKIVLPQLIYSPSGQRLSPVVCNKAGFIVHLSSTLQFCLSPWQPYSIPQRSLHIISEVYKPAKFLFF